jgi:hypothetical protein
MIPWERDIYVGLLINYLKEERDKARRENTSNPSVPKY